MEFFSITQIIPCQQIKVIYHNFVQNSCILVHFESEGAAGKKVMCGCLLLNAIGLIKGDA